MRKEPNKLFETTVPQSKFIQRLKKLTDRLKNRRSRVQRPIKKAPRFNEPPLFI